MLMFYWTYLNPFSAQAANFAGYKSIPMCTARQIDWLVNVKVDLEHNPLHRYNFAIIAAICKQKSALESYWNVFKKKLDQIIQLFIWLGTLSLT